VAKTKRRVDRSLQERSAACNPGGQPCRAGSGLVSATEPDRRKTMAAPAQCSRCDGALAADAGLGLGQVWDIPRSRWRRCTTCCPGAAEGAAVRAGRHGGLRAERQRRAIPLGIKGTVPVERTVLLMTALAGTPASTGFVARALLDRFAECLAAPGFDEAMKSALHAKGVLCADETPTNVIRKVTDTAHRCPDLRTRSRCAPNQQARTLSGRPARTGWVTSAGDADDPGHAVGVVE